MSTVLYNPYLHLKALKPIFVQVLSKDYLAKKLKSDFTVVIVVKNEASSINSLLVSIDVQSISPRQIIIVDGGSTDSTTQIIARFHAKSKLPIALYSMPESSISEGANFGIVNANTELIVTLHAGCILDKNCFANLIGPFEEGKDTDLVGGIYHSKHEKPANYLVPDWEAVDWFSFIPSSRVCCFKKSIAIQAGLFPTDLLVGEDTYFFVKYRSLSESWVINKNASLSWDAPATFKSYAKVLHKYAAGDGISGLGDYLYYTHYRAFEHAGDKNKQIYIAGYKDGKKQRYGHLFYKERIKGILIIFADQMMYKNATQTKLLELIKKYISKKWHIIYLSPTLPSDSSSGQQGIYLPLDIAKIDLISLETFVPSMLSPYLRNHPIPVDILNRYHGFLWRYKVLLTTLLYTDIIKR